MKVKLKNAVFDLLLLFFWVIPLLPAKPSGDADYINSDVSYGLFILAAFLCQFLKNRHAALISASLIGVVLCVFRPFAVYDILPALLLFCWLRCYLEQENGNSVTGYLEVFTDLIFIDFAAAIIRLLRQGYSFIKLKSAGIQGFPDFCLMALLLLLFLALFVSGTGNNAKSIPANKKKEKARRRSENKIIGLIPVVVSLRTYWLFCTLMFAAAVLQYTNVGFVEETMLFLRSGFRLLLLPWISLLFFIFEFLSSKKVFLKLDFRG